MPAVSPALPLHEAGKYVAGAYIVLFAIVLIYVAIMAIRLSRIERELGELLELSERDRQPPRADGTPGEATSTGGGDARGAYVGSTGTGGTGPGSAATESPKTAVEHPESTPA
jgi:hypothetical protein